MNIVNSGILISLTLESVMDKIDAIKARLDQRLEAAQNYGCSADLDEANDDIESLLDIIEAIKHETK